MLLHINILYCTMITTPTTVCTNSVVAVPLATQYVVTSKEFQVLFTPDVKLLWENPKLSVFSFDSKGGPLPSFHRQRPFAVIHFQQKSCSGIGGCFILLCHRAFEIWSVSVLVTVHFLVLGIGCLACLLKGIV